MLVMLNFVVEASCALLAEGPRLYGNSLAVATPKHRQTSLHLVKHYSHIAPQAI